jgi:hypothetical protein
MRIMAADALFLLCRAVYMLSEGNGSGVLMTGITQLVFAHLQIDAANHPVGSMARLARILG